MNVFRLPRRPLHQTSALPLLALVTALLLLSSITPAIKYAFQHSAVTPLSLACSRITIGFVFLSVLAFLWDRGSLQRVKPRHLLKLALLGILGVTSYVIAAWGLQSTSVGHYAMVYSLLPSITMAFSVLVGKETLNRRKIGGIVLSFLGCVVALSITVSLSVGFGDFLVLLFTTMMAAYLALSVGTARVCGAMTANAVMFGASSLVLLPGGLVMTGGAVASLSSTMTILILYIGIATAGVFLLRYVALQSLPPATVAVYHNLVPLCSIAMAYLFLAEAVTVQTIIGAAMTLLGTEVVRSEGVALAFHREISDQPQEWVAGTRHAVPRV